jgi:hypothetical protein
VAIRELNLAGDEQADLTVHGGSEKAVYAYPAEHYEYWRNSSRMTRCRGVLLVRTSQPRGCGKTRYALGTFSGSGLPFFRLPSPACPVTNLNSDSTETT